MKRSEVGDHKFLVFGAARSGIGAAKLLKRHGADVLLVDGKDSPAAEVFAELRAAGISSAWGPDPEFRALDGRTIMVKSPGIPQTNAMVQEARRRGLRIISEIELASAFVHPDARVIAITGTNGKTTTTAWIAHILRTAGLNGVPAGNIGDAWSNLVDQPENQTDKTVFAVECSSFQLEDLEDFRPDVALLTNFSPDHMDRYATLDDYLAAKANIFRNMREPNVLIVNGGDSGSKPFRGLNYIERKLGDRVDYDQIVPEKSFGLDYDSLEIGVREGHLTLLNDPEGNRISLISIANIPLPGRHNLENAAGAAVAVRQVGVDVESIRQGLRTFPGVEHRIEFCGERTADHLRFYNDSKATNVDSTEKALLAFEDKKIVLIAGGRDKHTGYAPLIPLMPRLRQLITLGEAAPLIENELGPHTTFQRATDMPDAVRRAAASAQPSDVVLLSPACASYDMYNNYEERGRHFKSVVAELLVKP